MSFLAKFDAYLCHSCLRQLWTEEIVTVTSAPELPLPMAANTNSDKNNVRMSGYLEKKGKLKVMSSWKTYWFVLEGRLLLYYRSKGEYALSPCKGSINLGPNCSIKPLLGSSSMFQIETRANTIVLKAKTRLDKERWMQAILSALNQNNASINGLMHFRYSSDDLIPKNFMQHPDALSRQNTLPSNRLKVEKRHTVCRSYEILQTEVENRPKSTIISNTIDVTKPKTLDPLSKSNNDQRESETPEAVQDDSKDKVVMFENAEYVTQDALQTIIVENTEYVPSSGQDDSVILDNVEYSTIPVEYDDHSTVKDSPEPLRGPEVVFDDGGEEYYAVSPISEAERELLRKKSTEKNDHIYERISGDSRLSYCIPGDAAEYATASEVSRPFLKPPGANEDAISVESDIYNVANEDSSPEEVSVENDQYCTPEMVIGDTELVSYHEYNVADKDKHIYSVPNFDHNKNRVSRDQTDPNPYSVCQLYPKSKIARDSTASKDDYALYDDPMELILAANQQDENSKNMSKFMRKLRKLGGSHQDIQEKKQPTPTVKKSNFLQKIFKRNTSKKKETEPEEVVEEIEYAQIDEEAVKKMDVAYCIDKKLLTELETILQMKKRKLEEILDDSRNANKSVDNSKDEAEMKPRRPSDTATKPKVPTKPPKKKTVDIQDDRYKNLKTIDQILDDLEEMKRSNTLTSGKVRSLIAKFDDTIKKKGKPTKSDANETSGVVLRSKSDKTLEKDVYNSNDELNRLLSELAKVTYAPILTAGVTNSLQVTCRSQDEEFLNLIPKCKRRHSEPDYDIPRPHTNLKIEKNNENVEDALVATRFFGPALPIYENKNEDSSTVLTSISPDSLESETVAANSPDINLASYSSHHYENSNRFRYETEKHIRVEEGEVFVDSLEPHHDCL
ncbi:hypothetical protein Trydic_g23856 [Trypoxylus dichotomus]